MQPADNPITEEFLQQNPACALVIVLVTGLLITGLLGSLASWIFLLVRRSQGNALLPVKLPWQPRKWALIEVLGIAIGALILNSVLALMLAQLLNVQRGKGVPLELAAAGGIGSLLTVIAGAIWICSRYKVSLPHVGFDQPSFRLASIGLIAGLVSLPGMYMLMIIVSAVFSSEYEHPLIDSAVESASLFGYLLAVFSAAFVAPIAEEFFFRVVLQGWMQSIPFKDVFDNLIGRQSSQNVHSPTSHPLIENPAQSGSFDGSGLFVDSYEQPRISANAESQTYSPSTSANGYLSTMSSIYNPPSDMMTAEILASPDANTNNQAVNQAAVEPPFWPCIVCGVLFGLAHFDYGMSFIPLSLLGIFLGWLYRQTHSIWPCIIVHMMLNSFSMIMLGLVIMLKQAGIDIGR